MEVAPYPNVADAFYLGMYVLLYAALALLLRDRIRPFPRGWRSTACSPA